MTGRTALLPLVTFTLFLLLSVRGRNLKCMQSLFSLRKGPIHVDGGTTSESPSFEPSPQPVRAAQLRVQSRVDVVTVATRTFLCSLFVQRTGAQPESVN
jgi:hypothetical protein